MLHIRDDVISKTGKEEKHLTARPTEMDKWDPAIHASTKPVSPLIDLQKPYWSESQAKFDQ
jgi:hypothetical protein